MLFPFGIFFTVTFLIPSSLYAQKPEKFDFSAPSHSFLSTKWAYLKGGEYHLDANGYYWILKSGTYKNFIIEVKTRYVSGTDNEGYGLILRESGKNHYTFYISANGYTRFLKHMDDKWIGLTEWVVADNCHLHGENMLKVEVRGKLIKCYINGAEIFSINDSEIKEGQVGLAINSELHVAFDDFTIEPLSLNVVFPPENYDFSSSSAKWPESERVYIKDGALNLDDTAYYWALKSGIYSDFTVEVKTQWISGTDNEGYGLVLRKTGDNQYNFYIAATGYAKFWKRFNGNWKSLTEWVAVDNFEVRGSNSLKVIARGKLIKCFVNGNEVFTINDSELDEGQAGLVINASMRVAFDNFSISPPTGPDEVKVPATPDIPGTDQTEAQAVSENMPTLRGSGDPLKGLNVSKARHIEPGNYYALVIGIDKYTGYWKPLNNAVSDAKAISALFLSSYKFDTVRTLYNEKATRKNIIKELEWLVHHTTGKDNVLIFYSGHGEYKKELNKGYWVPIDAESASTSEFISNADIQIFLAGIKARHTLLVSDACFSGDILRGQTISIPFEESDKYYSEVFELPSRQALTSGGVQPVMDGGGEGHSVFTWYLLKALLGNQQKYFDAGQLYEKIKIPIINNSDQTPQFNAIKNTGDEGGQFIFIKK
ncbi:MAG: caspase family protein [Bacteroidetes bacterium]|nr:caspase family protein [Bacteroidota bacterium]